MSTTKISDLPVLSSADAADEFVVVDDSAGVTKKITQAGLADFGSNTLTAGGITFGADTLDDYEEGTWDANISIGTVGTKLGKYVKIGNFVQFWLHLNSITASGGNVNFELPFSTAAGSASPGATRSIGITTYNTFQEAQLGVLGSSNAPTSTFVLTDGNAFLTATQVSGEQFFVTGSFYTS